MRYEICPPAIFHSPSHLSPQKWICSNCDSTGHGHWECTKPRGYKTMKCHRCDEMGHLGKECTNKSVNSLFRSCAASLANHIVQKWICSRCKGSGHGHWECSSRPCVVCLFFSRPVCKELTCLVCRHAGCLAILGRRVPISRVRLWPPSVCFLFTF